MMYKYTNILFNNAYHVLLFFSFGLKNEVHICLYG